MSNLPGRVAIVTGASKGIGAAIATALVKAGAGVAVNYFADREGAERTVPQHQSRRRQNNDAAWVTGERISVSGGLH